MLNYAARMSKENTNGPLHPLSHSLINQTDTEVSLAMRHVGLCTLLRWTNRADRSVILGYQGA